MKPYYEHGGITLFHADWRECGLEAMPKFDLLLTDPPYGILNLEGSGSTTAIRKSPRQVGSGKLKNRILNTSDVRWDSAPSPADLQFLRDTSKRQVIWGGNYFELPPSRGILVWDKVQPWPNFSQVEIAWTNLDRPASLFHLSCITGNPNKSHPTQKPLALMKWCLSLVPTAKTVLDPYCGSGTTLVACKAMGLTAVGVEREESYCEIVAKRLEQEVFDFTEAIA